MHSVTEKKEFKNCINRENKDCLGFFKEKYRVHLKSVDSYATLPAY